MPRKYVLLIKTSFEVPDYEDGCFANSKKEAAEKFLYTSSGLRNWTSEELLPFITEAQGDVGICLLGIF